MTVFNAKFFCGDAKFTLVELGRTRQFLGEDLDIYIKRFHEKALDYCNAIDKETLVDFCLHGMTNEYYVYRKISRFLPSPS